MDSSTFTRFHVAISLIAILAGVVVMYGLLIEILLKRGLQRDSGFERRWPEVLGTLLET